MKTILFDGGFVLDDPNSYWGDPSYQLEPGDPNDLAAEDRHHAHELSPTPKGH